MKKLELKSVREKKEKRRNILFSLFMLLVIVFGIAGFGFMSGSGLNNPSQEGEVLEYNGHNFLYQNGYWYLRSTKGESEYSFVYNPEETSEIEISSDEIPPVSNYQEKPLYIQSNNSLAKQEVLKNLDQHSLRTNDACLSRENCPHSEDAPVKDCTDNFIIIKEFPDNSQEKASIKTNESCVFINSPKNQTMEVVDEFIFKTLEIKG